MNESERLKLYFELLRITNKLETDQFCVRITGHIPYTACLQKQVEVCEEPKWISLLKEIISETNQLPKLQISEHLSTILFEAVLAPHL